MGDVINLSASADINVPFGAQSMIQTCSRLCTDFLGLLKKAALLALILAMSPFLFYGFWKIVALVFCNIKTLTCAWIFGFIIAFCYSVYVEECGGGVFDWFGLNLDWFGLGGCTEHVTNTLSNAAGIFGSVTNNVMTDGTNFFSGMMGGTSDGGDGGQDVTVQQGGIPAQPSTTAVQPSCSRAQPSGVAAQTGGLAAQPNGFAAQPSIIVAHASCFLAQPSGFAAQQSGGMLNPPFPGAIPFECNRQASHGQRTSLSRILSPDQSGNQVKIQGGGPSRVTVGSLASQPHLEGGRLRSEIGEIFNRDPSSDVLPGPSSQIRPPAEKSLTSNPNSTAESGASEPGVDGVRGISQAGAILNQDARSTSAPKKLSFDPSIPLVKASRTGSASMDRRQSKIPAASTATMLTGKQFTARDIHSSAATNSQVSSRRKSQFLPPNLSRQSIELLRRRSHRQSSPDMPGALLGPFVKDPRRPSRLSTDAAGQVFN